MAAMCICRSFITRGTQLVFKRNITTFASSSWDGLRRSHWYHETIKNEDREKLLHLRSFDFQKARVEDITRLSNDWILDGGKPCVSVTIERSNYVVRPLWVSVRTRQSGISLLYISIVPVNPSNETDFLQHAEHQAVYESDWTFEQCDRSNGDWRNYFIGVVGEVGCLAEDTLWPTHVFYKDRHQCEIRTVKDIGRFLADPTKKRVEEHRDNIIALQSRNGSPLDKNFIYQCLVDRWGIKALNDHNISL